MKIVGQTFEEDLNMVYHQIQTQTCIFVFSERTQTCIYIAVLLFISNSLQATLIPYSIQNSAATVDGYQ